MSELVVVNDNGGVEEEEEAAPFRITETREALEKRHKAEVRSLELQSRANLKAANKNKKKTAEAEANNTRLQYELRYRHKAEMEALEEAEENGHAIVDEQKEDKQEQQPSNVDECSVALGSIKIESSTEDKEKEKRRAKAQKKREKAQQKEKDREREIEEARLNAGPSARDIELLGLTEKLTPHGLAVHPIISDGHCLYRAVAHQLGVTGRRKGYTEGDYPAMRRLTATHLRANADTYSDFLGEGDADSYEEYCTKVEKGNDWGGELEARALAAALNTRLEVWRAGASPLEIGNDSPGGDENILRVSYHLHYYTLGEHYNSVVPLGVGDDS